MVTQVICECGCGCQDTVSEMHQVVVYEDPYSNYYETANHCDDCAHGDCPPEYYDIDPWG